MARPKKQVESESKAATTPVSETKPEPKADSKTNSLLAKKLAAQAKLIKDMGAHGGLASELRPPEFYPTGLEVFDKEVIGLGGLPKGRIVEVYGPKSSGKSALAMYLAGQVQKLDASITIKIYDHEASFTPAWGKSLGLDLDRLDVVRSMTAETMGSMIQADLALGELAPNIIIIDSIAIVQPESVMEKELEDLSMRDNLARASFLTKFLDSLTFGFFWPPVDSKGLRPKESQKLSLADTKTTILAINHAKERTKSAGGKTWTEWYHVGGVAMDFHACMQFMVKRIGFEEGADGNVGFQRMNVCADKNKLAPPKRECVLKLSFEGGMEQVGTIDWLAIAIRKGLAEQAGAWIESHVLLPKGKIQGAENFNKFIESNPEKKQLLIG